MRYGIFADVHANLEALDAVLGALKKEAIEQYLCVGDVVGYAVNHQECIDRTKAVSMITIAGNHDWASVDLLSLDYFNPYALEAVVWTRNNLNGQERYFLESLRLVYQNADLTLVHGTLKNPEEFNYLNDGYAAQETFRLLETNLCFVGHTHIAGVFMEDSNGQIFYRKDESISLDDGCSYIVNVGSVGQPRDGNPKAAYCIYDSEKKEIQIKRVNYDFGKTREKIIAAGLPEFLGNRLLVGR